MENLILRNIFDPGWFKSQPREKADKEEKDKKILERAEFERLVYKEVVKNLTKDLEELGLKRNYATEIIIREIALDLILMSRIKFEFITTPIVQTKTKCKTYSSRDGVNQYSRKKGNFIIEDGEVIHPLYSDFLPKLEKRLNKNLGLLGLLPQQQVERQKLIIIQRLKKRLFEIENNDQKYEVEAKYEQEKEI